MSLNLFLNGCREECGSVFRSAGTAMGAGNAADAVLEEDKPVKLGFKVKALGAVLSNGPCFRRSGFSPTAAGSAAIRSRCPRATEPGPVDRYTAVRLPRDWRRKRTCRPEREPNSVLNAAAGSGHASHRSRHRNPSRPHRRRCPPRRNWRTVLRLNVTYVEVPVTVKDSKGTLLPALPGAISGSLRTAYISH